jgi:hypothetical protein
MGLGGSKNDNVVVNEQINVPTSEVNNLPQMGSSSELSEVILISSVVTIVWMVIVKTVTTYFKKQVRAYSVNV